eukprot:229351_1
MKCRMDSVISFGLRRKSIDRTSQCQRTALFIRFYQRQLMEESIDSFECDLYGGDGRWIVGVSWSRVLGDVAWLYQLTIVIKMNVDRYVNQVRLDCICSLLVLLTVFGGYYL